MVKSLFSRDATVELWRDLRRANTEAAKKERLIQYLSVTFASDPAAQALVSALTLGAERTIANIPRGTGTGRGRADTQTETVIIEWEKDLAKTGEHAKDQLEEYLLGNWRSGQEYKFVLVTSDGIRWRRYAPEWATLSSQPPGKLSSIDLREVSKFDLSEETADEFPFWLDELLFGTQTREATLEGIQRDFGDTSSTFINAVRALADVAGEPEATSELAIAYAQWQRFLSIAYGHFDASEAMFFVHTYLSVFAKFIAHAVVTHRDMSDEASVRGALDGSAFEALNIERFVEDDFFHWVHAEPYFSKLRPMFRAIARKIGEYDFNNVGEDILKGVYQDLIDLDTRHALGEYYTPDWLCEKVLESVPLQQTSRVLDPACGSGSFLRAAVARLRAEHPKLTAEQLAHQVVGIDIHPLSVQIAKTTLLLALGDKVAKARSPVVLQVFLANSLLVPRGSASLFESDFEVTVDNGQHVLDVHGIASGDAFDDLITLCDDLVCRYKELLSRTRFSALVASSIPAGTAATLPEQLYNIYKAMKEAREAGRDSIWKFILQNSYKPVFLMNRFDVVVGNPPWLTYSDIGSPEYQNSLLRLADAYGVTPKNKKNMPHLEIAAIFLAHSINYFVSQAGGVVAFVLPRSFMSADQHGNTREGAVEGMRITSLWDLKDVTPLFRVPCCVIFAAPERSPRRRLISKSGLPGLRIAGRLPSQHMHYRAAARFLTDKPMRWHLSTLLGGKAKGAKSAITDTLIQARQGANSYASRFKQGATIVPRSFYFVDIAQKLPPNAQLSNRTVSVRTSELAAREAKGVWKGRLLSGRVEADLLFRTALARSVLPFVLISPPLITAPVVTTGQKGARKFEVVTAEVLLRNGYRYASGWFHDGEKAFEKHRTKKYAKAGMTLQTRLDFQHGLTAQSPDAKFLVLYTASGTDASAVVVDRTDSDLPFIVDHKTYWCEARSLGEAEYLAAFLNSGYANKQIKGFQSMGLFGERDIHKTIVKLPFPAFDPKNPDHLSLVAQSHAMAAKARTFAAAQGWTVLQQHALGRARLALRRHLAAELKVADELLEKICRARAVPSKAAVIRKKEAAPGPLFGEA